MRAALMGAAALLFAGCGPSDFDRRITEGTYHGFTIGESGPAAYDLFRIKRLEKGNSGFLWCRSLDPDGSRIAQAGASYGLWNEWDIGRYSENASSGLALWFAHDTLRNANVWGIGKPADLVNGMRWDSALSLVKRIFRDSLKDSIEINISEKNFDKDYDACLVDSAFGPYLPEDSANVWRLGYGSSSGCSEGLRLLFRNGVLAEIRHSRNCVNGFNGI